MFDNESLTRGSNERGVVRASNGTVPVGFRRRLLSKMSEGPAKQPSPLEQVLLRRQVRSVPYTCRRNVDRVLCDWIV